jgi:energy-coupling factor transporter transmembrane protein EcfT
MVSRGYNGKIKLHSNHPFTFTDVAAIAIIVITVIAIISL